LGFEIAGRVVKTMRPASLLPIAFPGIAFRAARKIKKRRKRR
jgi:hypothetical protein